MLMNDSGVENKTDSMIEHVKENRRAKRK